MSDWAPVLTFFGILFSGALSVYTLRVNRRTQAEDRRADVEGQAYSKADAINDAIVERLNQDIARLAKQGAEREAYAMQTEARHREEIAVLTQRAERAEERADRAERRAQTAERAVLNLQRRLDVLDAERAADRAGAEEA